MIKSKPTSLHTRQFSLAAYFILIYQFAVTVPNYAQPAGLVAFNGDTQLGLCLAASPEGKYIYSSGISTIAVFSRRPDGALITKYVLNNYHGEIEGLTYVVDMAVSPDGRHLYAANLDLDKHWILTFERDLSTGAITLIDTRDFPSIDIYSFDTSHKLFLSPDGKKLYWFFRDRRIYASGAFMLFARDEESGRLTMLQTLKDGDSQLRGFKVPAALAVTSDGKHLYGLGRNGESILVLAHDSTNGFIRCVDSSKMEVPVNINEQNASIVLSSNGLLLYASFYNWHSKGTFSVFARNPITGEVRLIQSPAAVTPGFILPSPDGMHLYSSNHSKLFSYKSDATGVLTPIGQFDCRCDATGGNVAFPTDGETIYSTYGEGVIALDRETQNGTLATLQIIRSNEIGGTDRLFGGRAVEVSPNGKRLYVGTDTDAAISVFARDEAQGRLALQQADSVGRISVMKISPQGEHLYATTQNNEIKIFALDHKSGALQLVQTLTDTVRQYHTLAFSPNGRQLYLADFNRVKVFARDPASGLLTGVQSFTRPGFWYDRAVKLEVSSEGKHAYWQSEHKIFMLKRDLSNGKLAFGDSLLMRLPGYDFVGGQRALQISPDGRHVYVGVTAYKYFDDDSRFEHIKIMFFERNPQTGALTFVEAVAQREWGNWNQVIDLVLSADGKDLYALLDFDGDSKFGLTMLTRDLETGWLSQRAFFAVTKGGVYGYDGPLTDMALSPDGAFLYFTDQLGVMTFATGRRLTSRVNENDALGATPPRALTLAQNYPNPFSVTSSSRATSIDYEIVTPETNALPIELTIYNVQGQQVATLVRQTQVRGKYSVTWNGINARGESVPSGIYFYRLKAGEQITTRKLMLLH